MNDDGWKVIHSYSRAQAIADGLLVDLTPWAKETAFKIPVAITRAAWSKTIEVPPCLADSEQSERGRGHDVLWMLFLELRRPGRGDRSYVTYQLFVQNEPHPSKPDLVTLEAEIGPGDTLAERVITIKLP